MAICLTIKTEIRCDTYKIITWRDQVSVIAQ